MGKPLLTDDIIEQANRQNIEGYEHEDFGLEDTRNFDSEHLVYKSRRIEQKKRKAFQRKLNLILVVAFILLAILIYAIFNW